MNVLMKAVVIGAALASLIVFCHLLFPVLAIVLMLGLIRRVWFGSRHGFAHDGYGPGWGGGWGPDFGGMRHHRSAGCWSQRMPTIDGHPWQRSGGAPARERDLQSI